MQRPHGSPRSRGLLRDPLLTRFPQGIHQKIHYCFRIGGHSNSYFLCIFQHFTIFYNYTVLSVLCLDGMRGPIWHYFQDDDVPNALSHLLLNANAWSLLGLPYLIILVRTYPSGNSPISSAFGIFWPFWGWWCSFSVWWDMMIVPWKASCFNSNSNNNNNNIHNNNNNNNMPYNFENNPTKTTGQSTCNCQITVKGLSNFNVQ